MHLSGCSYNTKTLLNTTGLHETEGWKIGNEIISTSLTALKLKIRRMYLLIKSMTSTP